MAACHRTGGPGARRIVVIRRSAAVVVALTAAGSFATPSAADAVAGRCSDSAAITVVVDPGPLGGATRVGCAPTSAEVPAVEAVQDAGFDITYANGQPFVCRVIGLPHPDQESCSRTPPADAYWGLFWSDGRSSGWTYSALGIASLDVPPGGSVGLRFQDGGKRDDPSLPATAPDNGSMEVPVPAAEARSSVSPGAPEPGGTEGSPALTWAAGGVVAALAAVALGLIAWRRRG